MKCRYFREWALYGIKPVPTKPSMRQYWWPSVNYNNNLALQLYFSGSTTCYLGEVMIVPKIGYSESRGCTCTPLHLPAGALDSSHAMRASDAWIEKLAMFISRRCDLFRWSSEDLPKMSPSSSTSIGSQIATWRRSLTWTRREFSFDLQSLLTGKIFVWLPTFLSLNPVQRDILPHRQSLSDLTIRLHITTSLKSLSQKRWLYHQILKLSFWPV